MLATPKKPTSDEHEIVERWQVALPPEVVVGLLQATCIDRTTERRTGAVVWNALWGPKFWSVRFEGFAFRLEPLVRNRHSPGETYEWIGEILPTKNGSAVELRVCRVGLFARDQEWILVIAFALVAAIFSIPFAAKLGVAGMIGVPILVFAWFMLLLRFTGTRQAAREAFGFLDQVFNQHVVTTK